jgi:hypothetical protein
MRYHSSLFRNPLPGIFAVMTLFRRAAFAFFLSLLFLAACAGKKPPVVPNENKVIPPAEFKVHPGLLGQPVPAELQPERERAASENNAETGDETQPQAPQPTPAP